MRETIENIKNIGMKVAHDYGIYYRGINLSSYYELQKSDIDKVCKPPKNL